MRREIRNRKSYSLPAKKNAGRKFLFALFFLFPFFSIAQNDTRSRIDIERRYLSYTDEKTLEKSREWIRQDSLYYIGHMYEGGFKFYRASDERGFQQVIVPLAKAFRLIEQDYDKQLRTRSSDIYSWLRVSQYQSDYTTIAYWLEQSYQNIEQPDKALEILKHVRDRNIQYEAGIETYNTMAWIYHRNRVYTPATGKKYAFLKNSVKENDSMAHMYLDSSIIKIQNDMPLNTGLFDASYLNRQYLFTYHYKAILFDYELEIDSANFYYEALLRTGYYSSNNYAEFLYAQADFQNSEAFFQEAESREGSLEKRTKEYYYMRGHIDIYKGDPTAADSLLRKVLDVQGSTPGFGWHSIGLARALQYEGLTAESQERLTKAAKFHELHIGTTWGHEQYILSIAALDYTNQLRFAQEFTFERDNWWFWFNPYNWYRMSEYAIRKQQNKLELASLVANNPERAQVIYPLFTSEALINFDETWSIIDGFGNEYFIRVYKKLLETDKRPKLKKYFNYMLGRLYLAKGEKRIANDYFQSVMNDPEVHSEYDVLLYARACEGMALTAASKSEKQQWTLEMYRVYPQLIPYTDLRMEFQLGDTGGVKAGTSGRFVTIGWVIGIFGLLSTLVLYFLSRAGRIRVKTPVTFLPFVLAVIACVLMGIWYYNTKSENILSKAMEDLQTCAIDFTNDETAPGISLSFNEKKDAIEITYSVKEGNETLQQGVVRVPEDKKEDAGKYLAYRLFGIKKKSIGEEPPPVVKKEGKKEEKKDEKKR
jgi:hypothetical protein